MVLPVGPMTNYGVDGPNLGDPRPEMDSREKRHFIQPATLQPAELAPVFTV